MKTKPYVIVGLGVTGLSCARYLAATGQAFMMMDSRLQPPSLAAFKQAFAEVPLSLGQWNTAWLRQAKALIVSPGIALEEPAIAQALAAGVPLVSDSDLWRQALDQHKKVVPIAAITGSNGKSTVTTLVGEMVKAAGKTVAVGGNLGVPVLDLLAQKNPAWYVVELSSFQLERSQALNAEVVSVLNISQDHQDRYVDSDAYWHAKQRIFLGCRQVVVNAQDDATQVLSTELVTKDITQWVFSAKVLPVAQRTERTFSLIEQEGIHYLARGSQPLLAVTDLAMHGAQNVANSLAALAFACAMQLPLTAAVEVLRCFTGLAHRCQFIAEKNGVHFYNDSKATNVGAAIASITGLVDKNTPKKIVLLAGGRAKDADFTPLISVIQPYCRAVVLFGEAAEELSQRLQGKVMIERVNSMDEAVQCAWRLAEAGDDILLAPACSSFDGFKNYAHRGDVFTQSVQSFIASEPL